MDYLILGLLVAGALLVVAGVATTRRRKIEHDRPDLGAVEALLAQGRTVAAVKAYREATGAGLVEAKTAVDRMDGRT
jgi:ribosomal protein L7/L12